MSTRKPTAWWVWIIVVAVIIIIIIVHTVSLGTIKVIEKESLPDALKDSKEDANKRHAALKAELDKKIDQRKKMERKVKIIYTFVRLTLVGLWTGGIYVLYHFRLIANMSDFLNYSEGSLIILLALNFITFGNVTNLNDFLSSIRVRVENFVWSTKITLSEDIMKTEEELNKMQLPDL